VELDKRMRVESALLTFLLTLENSIRFLLKGVVSFMLPATSPSAVVIKGPLQGTGYLRKQTRQL
jgi:hypothetical protein